MRKGVLIALSFYVISIAATWLAWLNPSLRTAHSPGLDFFIVFLTLLGGFIWNIIAVIDYFSIHRKDELKQKATRLLGTIIVHTAVLFSAVLYCYFVIRRESKDESMEMGGTKIEIKGDTFLVSDNGNLLYMKVGDSVLFDVIGVEEITRENTPSIALLADSVELRDREIKRMQKIIDSLKNANSDHP